MTGDKPKSLLFISIDFPPARTSGIYRPVFFTKYLIEAGWDVTLLTASAPLSPATRDFTLLPVGGGAAPLSTYLRASTTKYYYCWDAAGLIVPDPDITLTQKQGFKTAAPCPS